MSVYNVYRSQNEFVERVTREFILRTAQSWAKWPSTTDYRICGSENWYATTKTSPNNGI